MRHPETEKYTQGKNGLYPNGKSSLMRPLIHFPTSLWPLKMLDPTSVSMLYYIGKLSACTGDDRCCGAHRCVCVWLCCLCPQEPVSGYTENDNSKLLICNKRKSLFTWPPKERKKKSHCYSSKVKR